MQIAGRILWLSLLLPVMAGCGGDGQSPGASLRVETEPSGAVVVLNGDRQKRSPARFAGVPVGKHLVVVTRDGYREGRRTVTLVPDQQAVVEFDLEPVEGLALIRTTPPGAEVFIDEVFQGTSPLVLPQLPLGSHRVRLTREGYIEKEVELDVEDRTPVGIDVALTSDSARLTVRSQPEGADVLINGSARGQTPLTLERLASGESRIQVELPGYYAYEERTVLRAGQDVVVNATLRPKPGRVQVVSTPPGARILVNDRFRGETPAGLHLSKGEYELRVETPGYAPESRTITIDSTDERVEEFSLNKTSGTLELVTEPAGVKVYIDGDYRGQTKAAAGEDETDVVSERFQLDRIPQGTHTLQLTKPRFESIKRTFSIEARQIRSMHVKLERLFIPDTVVRMGSGPDKVMTGYLVERHPNGDVELEVRPGVIVLIEADRISQIRPLREEESSPE